MHIHLMHIPKTGGMTLYRALQQAGAHVTRSHDPAEAVKAWNSALVVTILRNPVDRIWSVYRYQLKQGRINCSLREFLLLDRDVWWWGVRSVQVRYLRPGVLYGTTDHLDDLICKICALAGAEYPEGYESHGVTNQPYTVEDYALMAAAMGEDAAIEMLLRGW